MNKGKFIGCIMIVVGTTIGAGMLGMPTVGAGAGFVWSMLLLLFLSLVSIFTTFLLLEVNLALPISNCSYSSMAGKTIGSFGKVIVWGAYLFLLYAIIVAYLIGGSDILLNVLLGPVLGIEIPHWLGAVLFTITFGVAVYWSTRAVDYFNRYLLSAKGILLIVTLVLLVPYIDVTRLMVIQNSLIHVKYIWFALPLFFTGFAYHFIIPSIRIYVGDEPRQLKQIFVISTIIATFFYAWWLAVAFGVIPLIGSHSFATIAPPPSGTIHALAIHANNNWMTASVNGFCTIALTTSFLGVALGLFDFLADGFKISDTKIGRLKTAGLTFIPPLLFAVFFPHGFTKALNYIALVAIFLTVVLPAVMVYFMRRDKILQSPYQVKCGNMLLWGIFIYGIIGVIVSLMFILDLLPKFV